MSNKSKKEPSLHLAILGTRGVPAAYGGFETFAEELALRLVKQNNQVTVFARKGFREKVSEPKSYKGIKIRYIPTFKKKYLETVLHALFSYLYIFFSRSTPDVALICNAANSPFAWILKLRGIPLLINVDGIERKRTKWNFLGKLWYKLGEVTSTWFANFIIADAQVIADYYLENYNCKNKVKVISYGAEDKFIPAGEVLKEFNLEAKKYILYVSRLEPENNALGVIQAYNNLNTNLPLVVVGDAPYADSYKSKLRSAANKNVIFTGFQFGEKYRELRSNCLFYVQATEVGGTHPALVEAMAHGNCIIANDVPEHREVLADTGLYYKKNDFKNLSELMEALLNDSSKVIELGKKAKDRASKLYTWEKVSKAYQELFDGCTNFFG